MNVFFQKSNKTHQKPEKAPGGLDQPAAIFGGGAPRENDLSFNFFLKKGSTKAIVIFITAVYPYGTGDARDEACVRSVGGNTRQAFQ